MQVEPLRTNLIGDLGPVFLVMAGAAALLLLIASANVAMLLANRAVTRQREFAVRLALGAGAGRLVRSTILETAMLTACATAMGWWAATVATGWLSRQTGLTHLQSDSDIDPLATLILIHREGRTELE